MLGTVSRWGGIEIALTAILLLLLPSIAIRLYTHLSFVFKNRGFQVLFLLLNYFLAFAVAQLFELLLDGCLGSESKFATQHQLWVRLKFLCLYRKLVWIIVYLSLAKCPQPMYNISLPVNEALRVERFIALRLQLQLLDEFGRLLLKHLALVHRPVFVSSYRVLHILLIVKLLSMVGFFAGQNVTIMLAVFNILFEGQA